MISLIQEVATGTAGALIVSFMAFCAAFVHNFWVRRKYPVGGSYVTHFEDMVQGNRVVQTSISRLKQRGRRLRGTTTLKNGRRWLIDGSIVGIGHISGVYSAEATDDEGVGSFYLRVNGPVLDGLWTGYDHVNKTITSGRYVFKRLLRVSIRPLQMSEASAVLAIAEKVFGPNYFTEADFKDKSGPGVYVGLHDRKVVGFAAINRDGGVSDKMQAPAKLPMDIVNAENNNAIGIIRTIAVIEELQGHGIGEQLFVAMERTLGRAGKHLIAVPAWEDDTGIHLRGVLSGNGYEPFLRCERYWKSDCDKGVFSCRCRQKRNECNCNLIWYKKALS